MTKHTTQAYTTEQSKGQQTLTAANSANIYDDFDYETYEKDADEVWLASERAKLHHRARRAMFR